MDIPSYQQIRKTANRAMKGDKVAESTLRKELTRLGKNANKRLKRLETEGLTASPAYKLAKEDIGYIRKRRGGQSKSRYPESNASLTINEVANALWSASTFLNRKTSSVRGYKNYLDSRRKTLENLGIDVKGREDKFDEFMRTDWFNEFVRFDSNAAFEIIEEMIDDEVSVSELQKLYDRYLQDSIDFVDATYDWKEYIE